VNQLNCLSLPVRKAVSGFLILCAAMMLIAAVERMNFIDSAAAKRLLGLIVGLIVMVAGNFLPKTRPLKGLLSHPAGTIAAERFAGWTLVLAGAMYAALFLFAPLDVARPLSSCIAACVILAIAANWAWLAWCTRINDLDRRILEETVMEHGRMGHGRIGQDQKLILFLLFAVFWILASACTAFLRENSFWAHRLASWIALGFGILYAALIAILDSGICRRKSFSKSI